MGLRQEGKKAHVGKEVGACPIFGPPSVFSESNSLPFSMLSGHTSTHPFRDLKCLAFGLGFKSTTK